MAGKALTLEEMDAPEPSAKAGARPLTLEEMDALPDIDPRKPWENTQSAKLIAETTEGIKSLPGRRPRNASELRAMAEAIPVGAAQSIFRGHLPQIAGGITSVIKGTPYLDERDQSSKDIAEIRSRSPLAYGLSNFGMNLAVPKLANKVLPSFISDKIASYSKANPLTAASIGGAAQGATYNPGETEGQYGGLPELGARSKQALLGAIMRFGMQGGGDLSINAGDRLMQKSVGRGGKYNSGVGVSLADEGVWGTREMMKGQVNKKAASVADETKALMLKNPRLLDSQPIADEVTALNTRKLLPSGRPNSSRDVPGMRKVEEYAAEIERRGMQTPADIHQGRINAGQSVSDSGWDNTDPAQALTNRISKAEQIGSSQLLKKEIPAIIPLDKRYEALAKAKKPLNKEGGGGGRVTVPTTTGIISSIPGSALGLSTLGRGGISLGRGAQRISPALLDSLLEQFMKRQHYEDEGQR